MLDHEKQMKEIGERIDRVIKDAGLSQREAAELASSQQCTVSSWVTGKYYPSTKALLELCDSLGCSVGYILTGEETSNSCADHDKKAAPDEKVVYKKPVIEGYNTMKEMLDRKVISKEIWYKFLDEKLSEFAAE